MAFLGKVGSILRQTSSRQITGEISASKPSIYQAIRCMSSLKIFVGGLSYGTDDQSLREAFSKYGYVAEARVIVDRETGRSRGFGFVTYSTPEEASSAIQALDGQDLHGRRVRVNYANDRPRGGGFGGGGFGGGGYGGGGYGGNYNNAYGAAGGGYGGNNAGFGGDNNYGSGGNYPSSFGGGNSGYEGGGNYGGGSTGGFNSGNYGVAGGSGGADSVHDGNTGFGNFSGGNSFGSGNTGSFDNSSDGFNFSAGGGSTDSGFDGKTGAAFGNNQFAKDESAAAEAAEDFDQNEPLDGNFRDEDDTDDFAKRA